MFISGSIGPWHWTRTLHCWSVSKEGQWSWGRVWRAGLVRSSWGNWGCLAWRRGGWGETLPLSTTRWVLVSSPKSLVIGQEEMASSCVRGGLGWILGKILYWKSGQALEQAAQGGDGVTIPGGVQNTCSRGTWGQCFRGMVVLGWRLDLMILEVFSNLNDSMKQQNSWQGYRKANPLFLSTRNCSALHFIFSTQ